MTPLQPNGTRSGRRAARFPHPSHGDDGAQNDRHGHHAGDRVLVEVVRRVRDHIRASDYLARWGGEKFMILLTRCDQKTAVNLAEKFRLLIAAAPLDEIGPVTTRFGVATYVSAETDEDWLRCVDGALYTAKAAGRNRVCLGEYAGHAALSGLAGTSDL